MKILSIPLVCLAASLTTACATSVVKTNTITEGASSKNPGVIYHLPMRLAKLNATRKAAPADLASAIAKAETDKKAAEEASKSALPTIKDLIERIDQAGKTTPPNEQAVIQLKNELEDARKAMADNVVKAQNLEAQIKALKELQALQAKNPDGKIFLYDLKVVLEDPIPDTSTSYVATLNKGLFRDDKLTIETTAAGLLTSGNATAAGREGDILVELAGAAGAFAFGGGTGAGASFQGVQPRQDDLLNIFSDRVAEEDNPYKKCMPLTLGDGPNDAVELRFDPSINTAVFNANCALWRNGFPFAVVVSSVSDQVYEDQYISKLKLTGTIDRQGACPRGTQEAAANSATAEVTVCRENLGVEIIARATAQGYIPPTNLASKVDEAKKAVVSAKDSAAAVKEALLKAKEGKNINLDDIRNKVNKSIEDVENSQQAVHVIPTDNNIQKRIEELSDKIAAETKEKLNPSAKNEIPNPALGLAYRRPVPRFITINQLKTGTGKLVQYPMQSALMLLPQLGERWVVPIKGRAFTKTVNDVTFENGMLTKWDTDQPSAAFEVVRLPVRMLEALFSVPANLIQLKFDVSSKAKSLAEVQAAQIKADAELLKLKACIETAADAEAALGSCFKD